jgi:hypothetical protein
VATQLCGVTDMDDNCQLGCERDTESWTESQRGDVFSCIIELDCEGLSDGSVEACFEDAGVSGASGSTGGSSGGAPMD